MYKNDILAECRRSARLSKNKMGDWCVYVVVRWTGNVGFIGNMTEEFSSDPFDRAVYQQKRRMSPKVQCRVREVDELEKKPDFFKKAKSCDSVVTRFMNINNIICIFV